MKMKFENKKQIGVFIDGSNLWHCVKANKWKIDYHKLKCFFYERGNVVDLYYFTPEMPHLEPFFDMLDSMKYKIIKKPIKVFRARNKEVIREVKHKGNLDVEMAITIIKNLSNYDEVILVTGDSDFECVLDELKSAGKSIVCMCNSSALAYELKRNANKVYTLDKLKRKLKFKKKNNHPKR
jgi:uncharacterized LabA/DUF88 family protein